MAVSRLVSLVEPVMILGLGAVIGAVLLGIMVSIEMEMLEHCYMYMAILPEYIEIILTV